jgi:hypothetical protein
VNGSLFRKPFHIHFGKTKQGHLEILVGSCTQKWSSNAKSLSHLSQRNSAENYKNHPETSTVHRLTDTTRGNFSGSKLCAKVLPAAWREGDPDWV